MKLAEGKVGNSPEITEKPAKIIYGQLGIKQFTEEELGIWLKKKLKAEKPLA